MSKSIDALREALTRYNRHGIDYSAEVESPEHTQDGDMMEMLAEAARDMLAIAEARQAATPGHFEYMGKDCQCNNCNCGYDIYAGEMNSKITCENNGDAKFTQTAANVAGGWK